MQYFEALVRKCVIRTGCPIYSCKLVAAHFTFSLCSPCLSLEVTGSRCPCMRQFWNPDLVFTSGSDLHLNNHRVVFVWGNASWTILFRIARYVLESPDEWLRLWDVTHAIAQRVWLPAHILSNCVSVIQIIAEKTTMMFFFQAMGVHSMACLADSPCELALKSWISDNMEVNAYKAYITDRAHAISNNKKIMIMWESAARPNSSDRQSITTAIDLRPRKRFIWHDSELDIHQINRKIAVLILIRFFFTDSNTTTTW